MPGTTLLTARDIEYRVKISGAKAVVVSQLHCEAVEKIKDQCPSLTDIIFVGGEREGWKNSTHKHDAFFGPQLRNAHQQNPKLL